MQALHGTAQLGAMQYFDFFLSTMFPQTSYSRQKSRGKDVRLRFAKGSYDMTCPKAGLHLTYLSARFVPQMILNLS